MKNTPKSEATKPEPKKSEVQPYGSALGTGMAGGDQIRRFRCFHWIWLVKWVFFFFFSKTFYFGVELGVLSVQSCMFFTYYGFLRYFWRWSPQSTSQDRGGAPLEEHQGARGAAPKKAKRSSMVNDMVLSNVCTLDTEDLKIRHKIMSHFLHEER